MWRAILLPKSTVKTVSILRNSVHNANASFKKSQMSSSLFLNDRLKSCLNQTQFSRTFVLNSKNLNTLKEPFNSNESKPKSKYDFEQLRKILAVFLSGCVAYFAITYVLDSKSGNKKISTTDSSNEDSIDYSSKNLPSQVKISKSVLKTFVLD